VIFLLGLPLFDLHRTSVPGPVLSPIPSSPISSLCFFSCICKACDRPVFPFGPRRQVYFPQVRFIFPPSPKSLMSTFSGVVKGFPPLLVPMPGLGLQDDFLNGTHFENVSPFPPLNGLHGPTRALLRSTLPPVILPPFPTGLSAYFFSSFLSDEPTTCLVSSVPHLFCKRTPFLSPLCFTYVRRRAALPRPCQE